jgi:methylase of polypeptide subunit release factors
VVRVDKDVFPPDIGYTTTLLADVLTQKPAACGLDMGTGTLLLALVMRRAGVREVWAADNHPAAVQCARENLNRNPRLAPIKIIASDLFKAVPIEKRFDLIVFNQPYYPIAGKKITGMGNDGGQEIISRFFQEAGPYLAKNGEILMPYSSIAGTANNPDAVASSLHWHGTRELTAEKAGIEHSIYAFRPQR